MRVAPWPGSPRGARGPEEQVKVLKKTATKPRRLEEGGGALARICSLCFFPPHPDQEDASAGTVK